MGRRDLELDVGDVVVVTVAGADAPAAALEALEDGSLRMLPAGGDDTPGPFVHDDRRAAGSPPPGAAPAPHR